LKPPSSLENVFIVPSMLSKEIPKEFNDRWNAVTQGKNWISRSITLNFKPAGFFSRYQTILV